MHTVSTTQVCHSVYDRNWILSVIVILASLSVSVLLLANELLLLAVSDRRSLSVPVWCCRACVFLPAADSHAAGPVCSHFCATCLFYTCQLAWIQCARFAALTVAYCSSPLQQMPMWHTDRRITSGDRWRWRLNGVTESSVNGGISVQCPGIESRGEFGSTAHVSDDVRTSWTRDRRSSFLRPCTSDRHVHLNGQHGVSRLCRTTEYSVA